MSIKVFYLSRYGLSFGVYYLGLFYFLWALGSGFWGFCSTFEFGYFNCISSNELGE